MKIANFLSHYPEPGGGTNAVSGLSRALSRLGCDVTIYSHNRYLPKQPETEVSVNVLEYGRWSAFWPAQSLSNLLGRDKRPDLLIVNGMFNPWNIPVVQAAKRAGLPYVICPHDPYHPAVLSHNRLRKAVYGALYERRMLNSAAAVQLLAEHHRTYLEHYGVSVAAFWVPNGFDPEDVPETLPKYENNTANCEFLFLGRLDLHMKGLDLLVQAFAAALKSGELPRNARLSIVGRDWGDRKRLEALSHRLSIEGSVIFHPRVENRWSVLARCSVFVLVSRYEGFGLAALEAMTAGKTVIVSSTAGIAPWVSKANAGYIVEPTIDSIRDGLVHAWQTRVEWNKRGEAGREYAYRHLTWNHAAKTALKCYERLLAN